MTNSKPEKQNWLFLTSDISQPYIPPTDNKSGLGGKTQEANLSNLVGNDIIINNGNINQRSLSISSNVSDDCDLVPEDDKTREFKQRVDSISSSVERNKLFSSFKNVFNEDPFN